MKCTAEFGEGGYRYKLGRDWSGELDLFRPGTTMRYALFIMLNPSTADAHQDDLESLERWLG